MTVSVENRITETVLETSFGNETKIEYVAYGLLCKSPSNVRKKAPTGIEELAVAIEAKGLMQNLVVHAMKGSRAKKAKLGVCAGQRRLAALDLLFERGKITTDHPVPVKVVSEAEAVAASLLENQHEPMHPADQCEAFRMLAGEGKSIEYIAALFRISLLMVRRRLKLANVSPNLLNLFRNDEMNIDQVTALALADDHDLQQRVWSEATEAWQREPRELRAAITGTEIDASRSHLARFVGLDAYEAAGGHVRRDLFSDAENAGYIADPDLLHKLATERLVAASQEVAKEGWAWVETRTKRDYGEVMAYGRLPSFSRELTTDEQTELDALIAKRDEADAKLNTYNDSEADEDDAQREPLEEQAYALNDQVDTFGERLETWADDDMKMGGVFITIDQDGELNIERGLVKRDDVARVYPKDDASDGEAGMATADPQPKEKPLHGEKLCRRLTAHRTAAVQAELSRRPVVALAAFMNRLIPTVFDERYRFAYAESAVKIDAHTSRDALVREADDMESSVAFTQIEADRAKWAKLLPKDVDDLLPWLLKQESDVMARLFAFCVAATLDSVSSTDRIHPINTLADVMQINMAYYWKPTQQSYLNHVSKARIIDVVTEAVSVESAAELQGMKKGDAAAGAELRIAESGWLPEVLRKRKANDKGETKRKQTR
ncbi:ParB/RepB/Spo0J family partition protein [Paraburkholderia ginsengiterrae]|nr:ParB/RepB/Spo0J family partition protein [Paraburkholderia ginsengiterrae]